MVSTAPTSKVIGASVRPLPLVVTFAGDEEAHRCLLGIQRFRRIHFDELERFHSEGGADVEHIFVVSRQEQMEAPYSSLRRPNVRVIAISDERFREPRFDGAVYAYLPAQTPPAILERMIDNAVDHIQLLANRREINDRLNGATREIQELNQIGAALSAEHDTSKLLELILSKARTLTKSDAGSLYLVEEEDVPSAEPGSVHVLPVSEDQSSAGTMLVKALEGKKRLRFKLAQNDSLLIPFREAAMEINDRSIAGYVALTGMPVNLEDAYRIPPEVPYSINRKFDEDSGYRTKSILAVPLRNQKDETVGVLQLINAKRQFDAKLTTLSAVSQQVIPFAPRQQSIVESLASQAAVALENANLYTAIQRLFEGFVRASVSAIESRDPTTSGHSFRVANLTVALAEVVDRAGIGEFEHIKFSRDEMKEIRYASLLHDFGKVGVREEVLVKAKKLYPAQMELIKQRFQFVKRSMQVESLQSRLDFVLQRGRERYLKNLPEFENTMAQQMAELDIFFQTILKADEPTVLPEGSFDRLVDIAARHYLDVENDEYPLLTQDEVRLLSIRKGSLDDSERQQIESHVVHTYKFLEQIPWTKEIKSIPAIARGHHEKLNGLGYPYKLSAPEIPIQTRMMTISDIFDALSASDRPYKRAVTLERALEILGFAVKDGEIDPSLFNLFRDAKVFEKWKVEPYPY